MTARLRTNRSLKKSDCITRRSFRCKCGALTEPRIPPPGDFFPRYFCWNRAFAQSRDLDAAVTLPPDRQICKFGAVTEASKFFNFGCCQSLFKHTAFPETTPLCAGQLTVARSTCARSFTSFETFLLNKEKFENRSLYRGVFQISPINKNLTPVTENECFSPKQKNSALLSRGRVFIITIGCSIGNY